MLMRNLAGMMLTAGDLVASRSGGTVVLGVDAIAIVITILSSTGAWPGPNGDGGRGAKAFPSYFVL